MIIQIKGKNIRLKNSEVRSAKRVVSNFLEIVQKAGKDKMSPTYYFTLLIIMHTMSQNLIDSIDNEVFDFIMNKLAIEDKKEN